MVNPEEEFNKLFSMIVPEGIVRDVLVKEGVRITEDYADEQVWRHDVERDDLGCSCGE